VRSQLPAIAREIGADERTLRRAAARGTLRCRRPGARQLQLADDELEYLRTHWGLLSALSAALRTEPNVGLALLYGSAARGDDHPSRSDIDLLVSFREEAPAAATELALRLEGVLERDVDVARLDRARASAPLLVLQALEEGRVLVDRDERWPALHAERSRIGRAAHRRRDADRREAADSLSRLLAGSA
jgi:predicted nucleotidyltransferase